MELDGVAPVILGFLNRQARSGYDIKAAVDRSTRFFWAASYGQIYPQLRRLEQAGLVRGVSQPTGGRQRRVYEITDEGRAALREWLLSPEAGYELRDLGLLKLFFASALSREEALEVLAAFRAVREDVLRRLRIVEANPQRPRGGFGEIVLAYGLERHEWEIAWTKNVEKKLKTETATAIRKRGSK